MIFSISEDLKTANKINQNSFENLNIWERQNIQEWVRNNPEMLGEELLIVTIEFDKFSNSSDRLDILALDRLGNLVVIELKRDSAAGYADLQAIRYAAMVSSMTVEILTPYYISYRNKYYNENLTEDEARNSIMNFVKDSSFTELSNKPRIIICSEGFSQEITATVLWLRQFDIDISCVTITPYLVDKKIVIFPKLIIPLEEAKQYLIDIKRKEIIKEQFERKARTKTMTILIENNLIKQDEIIFLKNNLPSYVHYKENDSIFMATITGKLGQSNAVTWHKDGLEYSISALAAKIFKELHPQHHDSGSINGSWYWVNSNNKSLGELAEDHIAKNLIKL